MPLAPLSEPPVTSRISSLSQGQKLLSGYGCDERGPYLVLDDLTGDHTAERNALAWQRNRVFVLGETFTLSRCEQRHCTGRHDLETGRGGPCPERASLTDLEHEQCSACFVATGFNPAFYNAPSISQQQRRRNLTPHVVYLVSFGLGALKVGMTHAPRRLSRLLEQGARLGAVIASLPNADLARELEADIARCFDVAEAVRAARKRQLLDVPLPLHEARRELAEQIARVAALHAAVDAAAPILELDRYYFGAERWRASFTDLSETQPPCISGRCVGMIGDVLVAAQGPQRFLLSIGSCVGHRVEIEPTVRENRFIGQLGLPF
jgi:uncharacterized protein DUF2797